MSLIVPLACIRGRAQRDACRGAGAAAVACCFDDELMVEVFTDRVGTTSLVLRFDIRRGPELAATVTNRYVWVSAETLRPATPPGDVRDAFVRSAPRSTR